jgi:hypothetical protein
MNLNFTRNAIKDSGENDTVHIVAVWDCRQNPAKMNYMTKDNI